MSLIQFTLSGSQNIDQHGSTGVSIEKIARVDGAAYAAVTSFKPNGFIGRHPTSENQLFLVLNGKGWVQGSRGERKPISAGQGAFWEKGEWHAAGTETGMFVLIIEGEACRPMGDLVID